MPLDSVLFMCLILLEPAVMSGCFFVQIAAYRKQNRNDEAKNHRACIDYINQAAEHCRSEYPVNDSQYHNHNTQHKYGIAFIRPSAVYDTHNSANYHNDRVDKLEYKRCSESAAKPSDIRHSTHIAYKCDNTPDQNQDTCDNQQHFGRSIIRSLWLIAASLIAVRLTAIGLIRLTLIGIALIGRLINLASAFRAEGCVVRYFCSTILAKHNYSLLYVIYCMILLCRKNQNIASTDL